MLLGLILSVLGVGCASAQRTQTADITQRHAECLVCKHNADLACVDVAVDNQTPHCVSDGKTYYFCSEECKRAFEKNPAKYLSH